MLIRKIYRFWFQNSNTYSASQIAELEKVTLARILCDNGDNIQSVPQDTFLFSSLVSCSSIPGMDLSRWSD